MSLINELKVKYRMASISEKLIFINVGIFAIVAIFGAIEFGITKSRFGFFDEWFALPEDLDKLIYKPWTFITHFFLHAGFMHLIFNMLVLYYAGRIFLNFFSDKQFINFYFLGGLVGGLSFVVAYNLLPGFANDHNILVGASAAVLAILIAAATYIPNYSIRLFGLFDMKLWVLAVLSVVGFIASVPSGNAGGEIAHLGGTLVGYLYMTNLKNGGSFDSKMTRIVESIQSWFSFKKKPLKTVYKKETKVGGHSKKEFNEFNDQKKIDLILDKISKSGYDSLTKAEKEILFKAGKK